MKNYLLKIACLSTLCFGLFIVSCSESDSDDPSNGDDPSDGGGSTVVLTSTCSVCPELTIDQTNGSGEDTFTYPAGTICKGEDGKAYYENGDPVDELGQTYEEHLEFLGSYARFCDPVE